MKKIYLSVNAKKQKYPGLYAIVDDADFESLSKFHWSAHHAAKGKIYAVRNEKSKTVRMHTQITGFKQTDHIDGNPLNNQRSNLRESTQYQNLINRKQKKPSRENLRGVYVETRFKNVFYYSRIGINGKYKYLGTFKNKNDAAIAYNNAALAAWGEYAVLNEVTPCR